MGHPGTLPVINKEAVRKVIKTGLALNCQIPEDSKFDRKNYFYPDLPKGYQISQRDMPFCKEGFLEINTSAGSVQDKREIRIREIHLEEDVGRLVHGKDYNPPTMSSRARGAGPYSLVDFNRAGIPLMELVTEPDLKTAQEARKFAEELQLILRYLEVSDADMEKGQMRVEVNISLSKDKKMGTKVEIKNLNSFRTVERAVDYEIERQTKVLDSGKKIVQETRGWDEKKQKTVSQREKEEAHDYRYFPEPDLPTLHLDKNFIQEIRTEIPELPQQKRERFVREYNLAEEDSNIFIVNKDLGEYFEKVVSELRNWIKIVEFKTKISEEEKNKLIKLASNYIITDLQKLLKRALVSGEDFLISPENFAEFISLIYEGKITSKIAKQVLEEMFGTGADPSHIVKEKGWTQLTNEKEIKKIIENVLSKNQKVVEDYKKGKKNALQFLIGQVIAITKGRANPEIVNRLIKESLTKTI